MKSGKIDSFLRSGEIQKRSKDLPRARSLVASAERNASAAMEIELSDKSSTLIFKELYDSIRQIGDAMWWILGYRPGSHRASMEIIKEDGEVSRKVALESLPRFKRIRNDSEYTGYKVTVAQAEEIISFWKKEGKELLNWMKSRISQ